MSPNLTSAVIEASLYLLAAPKIRPYSVYVSSPIQSGLLEQYQVQVVLAGSSEADAYADLLLEKGNNVLTRALKDAGAEDDNQMEVREVRQYSDMGSTLVDAQVVQSDNDDDSIFQKIMIPLIVTAVAIVLIIAGVAIYTERKMKKKLTLQTPSKDLLCIDAAHKERMLDTPPPSINNFFGYADGPKAAHRLTKDSEPLLIEQAPGNSNEI